MMITLGALVSLAAAKSYPYTVDFAFIAISNLTTTTTPGYEMGFGIEVS